MRNTILYLSLSVMILFPDLSLAQDKDTVSTLSQLPFDSLYRRPPNSIKRLYRGLLLLPATFIVYGAASLKWNRLKSVNDHIKEEVYLEGNRKVHHLDNYMQYAPGLLVYALNIAGIKGENNFRDRTVIYAMANVIMGTAVTITKSATHELRPDGSDYMSFPSGHTATAFAAAEFMRREYKDVSIWYGVAGYAMATATGYLRMSNDKHWFGDVVAGAGVGILSTELAYYLYPSVKRLFKTKRTEGSNVILPTYQQGRIGLSAVHIFR